MKTAISKASWTCSAREMKPGQIGRVDDAGDELDGVLILKATHSIITLEKQPRCFPPGVRIVTILPPGSQVTLEVE